MRLTRRLSGLRTFVPWALTTTTAISGYATAAEATAILDLINSAKPGTTVTLPTGTYTAPVGTSLFINKPLTILGNNATLVNVRLNFASNISLSNLTLIEQDCVFHISDPNACSPATPMISIGGNNSVVNQAQLKQITLNFGRAYTGIAFGQGSVSNLVIDGFDITSNEMSAITALGGHNIRIANGVMRGGNWANVDDGVALYSIYDELRYVVVENIRAENIFDAVGIGAHLFKPLRDINVRGVSCVETAVCLYFKAGDVAPPTGVRAYSQMSGISVDRVENLDPTGKRYLSTIWMYAKGGASAKDISVSNVYTSARASTSTCAHLRVFTDPSISTIDGFRLQNATFAVSNASTSGYLPATVAYMQTMKTNTISNMTLSGIRADGLQISGIDSMNAVARQLAIESAQFTPAVPGVKIFRIPYPFRLDGVMVPPRDQ